MEPGRNLLNFNNAAVARATFCTKWKSTFIVAKVFSDQNNAISKLGYMQHEYDELKIGDPVYRIEQ